MIMPYCLNLNWKPNMWADSTRVTTASTRVTTAHTISWRTAKMIPPAMEIKTLITLVQCSHFLPLLFVMA